MRLWVLKRLTEQPVYDANNGFVIRASDPSEARMIATSYTCDEGKDVWLSTDTSSCDELL